MIASIVALDVARSEFVIDVDPLGTPQHRVFKHVFKSGECPDFVTAIETKGPPGQARWIFAYTSERRMMHAIHRRYIDVMLAPQNYQHGWKTALEVERRADAERREALLKYAATRQPQFANYSPNELLQLGPGAYKTAGKKGMWIWVGTNLRTGRQQLQWYPMSGYDKFDEDVTWYLERGCSINEALKLQINQFDRIFYQKIGIFASVLTDVVGLSSIGPEPSYPTPSGIVKRSNVDVAIAGAEKVSSGATAIDWLPTPSHRHAMQAVAKAMQQHPEERRIAEINKRRPVPIKLLSPR